MLLFDGHYLGHFDQALVEVDADGRLVPEERGVPHAVTEQTVLVPLNDVAALSRALERRDIALVLTEPALTNNFGLILPDPGYHEALRRLTRETGTLLAIDETHTQVFGPGGLTAAWGLDPDLVTCGKSIAGGVPFGAWGMTEAIAHVLTQVKGPDGERSDLIAIGGTLFGNALSMAAARATMTEILTPEAYANTQRLGARLADGMRATVARVGLPWHIHHLGPRAGYTFQAEPVRDAAEARACQDDLLTRLIRIWLANRGVWEAIVGAGPVCSVPASDEDVDAYLAGWDVAAGAAHPLGAVLQRSAAPRRPGRRWPPAAPPARRGCWPAPSRSPRPRRCRPRRPRPWPRPPPRPPRPRPRSPRRVFSLGGGIRMLARMLARAPMIPTPAIMTKTPVIRPSVEIG